MVAVVWLLSLYRFRFFGRGRHRYDSFTPQCLQYLFSFRACPGLPLSEQHDRSGQPFLP